MPSPQPPVALITGGGSGMGLRYAQRLLDQGWKVAVLDVSTASLAALGDRAGLLPLVVDVRDAQAVEAAVAETERRLGPLQRVVNCAAIMPFGELVAMEPATVHRLFDINVGGLVNLTTAALPRLIARGRGEFVSFASLAGHVPIFYMGAYSATKFAVVAYTEVLAQETRGSGVQLHCVCPPAVNTPLLEQGRATRWPRFLDHFPPLPPDAVLDDLDRAIARRRFWVFPGPFTRLSIAMRRWMPGLLWWMVRLIERPGRAAA